MPLLQHSTFTNGLSKLLQTQSKINILFPGTNLVLFLAIVEAKPSYFQVLPIGVLGLWVRLPPPPPTKGRKDDKVMFMDCATFVAQDAKNNK